MNRWRRAAALVDWSPRILVALLAGTAAELAAVSLMATAAWLIARAAEQPPLAALTVAIVAVRALALARGAVRYAERLIGHDAALRALAGARERLFRAIAPLAPGGLPAVRTGDVMTRLVTDLDAIQDLLLRCVAPATAAVLTGTAGVALFLVLSPGAAAALSAGLLVAALLLPALAWRGERVHARAESAARTALVVHTVDTVRGTAELAAYGATESALLAGERAATRLARCERRRRRSERAVAAGVTATQWTTAAAVTVAAVAGVRDGSLAPSSLAVLVIATVALFETVAGLPEAARRLARCAASLDAVLAVLEAPVPVREPDHPAAIAPGVPTLRVSGLVVRHPGSDRDALGGVNLTLPAGSRTAVVGPSGSGKSTLVAALLRFVEPAAGSITVNGVDLARHRTDDVLSRIGGLTQDAHLFHASIRTNLEMGDPTAGEDRFREVLADVALLEWLDELPRGQDPVVEEGGSRLSGGQRRRLLVARALLRDPDVLVLDEPTEGLDAATARRVLDAVLAARPDRTLLLVTHEPHRLELMDDVLVLEHGRIAGPVERIRDIAPNRVPISAGPP